MQTEYKLRDPIARKPGVALPILVAEAWAAERARRKRQERGLRVELTLLLNARNGSSWRETTTLQQIERLCLKGRRPRRIEADGSCISFTVEPLPGRSADAVIRNLLQCMHDIAEERDCDLEAAIRHRPSGGHWF
jgi:hypothetical protein